MLLNPSDRKFYGGLETLTGRSSPTAAAQVKQIADQYENDKRIWQRDRPRLRNDQVVAWNGTDLYNSATDKVTYTGSPEQWSPNDEAVLILYNDGTERGPPLGCQLWLKTPLAQPDGQCEGFCEVWLVQLEDQSGRLGRELVLKLYDPTWFRAPWPQAFRPWLPIFFGDGLATSETYAHNKAEAYRILEKFQGNNMPMSYGHYTFKLPLRTDPVPGMVMEYLPLPRAISRIKSALREQKVEECKAILERAFTTEETIKKAGVIYIPRETSSILLRGETFVFVGLSKSWASSDPRMANHLPAGAIQTLAYASDNDNLIDFIQAKGY